MPGGRRQEPGPRPRMGHLLLWIAGCAIGFAESRPSETVVISTFRDGMLWYGSSVVWAMALGSLATGCGLMAYRRWRGDLSYPSRAGHWLLLRILAISATRLAVRPLRMSTAAAGAIALMIHLAFLRGVRHRLPRHWVAVFLVASIASAVRLAVFLALALDHWPLYTWRMSYISGASAVVDALATLWAIGRDRRDSVPADGLHRLGVATALLIDASSVIFSLLVLFW